MEHRLIEVVLDMVSSRALNKLRVSVRRLVMFGSYHSYRFQRLDWLKASLGDQSIRGRLVDHSINFRN